MSEQNKEDVKQPGDIGWSELITTDKDAAVEFYTNLNGWTTEEMILPDDMEYTIFKNNDVPVAGCMAASACEVASPMWLNYIQTADLDKSTESVIDLGGKVIKERVDIPMGSFVVFEDPQGIIIALWECKK